MPSFRWIVHVPAKPPSRAQFARVCPLPLSHLIGRPFAALIPLHVKYDYAVSPGPVEGYLSISIVTKGNPATVNKVGIGNDDNSYIYGNARFKVGSAVNS